MSRQEALLLVVEDESGFVLQFSPKRTSISFQHRVKVRSTSGDANPTVQMLTEPRPFTQLLDEVSQMLMHVLHALDPKANGVIERIGIVSATNLSDEDCPPGIRNLLAYFGKPWGEPLDKGYSVTMTNPLHKAEKYSDRCIHTLQKAEEEDDALILAKFDWQRKFDDARSVRGVGDALGSCKSAALTYFEHLAEGKNINAVLNR